MSFAAAVTLHFFNVIELLPPVHNPLSCLYYMYERLHGYTLTPQTNIQAPEPHSYSNQKPFPSSSWCSQIKAATAPGMRLKFPMEMESTKKSVLYPFQDFKQATVMTSSFNSFKGLPVLQDLYGLCSKDLESASTRRSNSTTVMIYSLPVVVTGSHLAKLHSFTAKHIKPVMSTAFL